MQNYTVEQVKELFEKTVVENFASNEEGQKHLNRIAKAITNESLDKRLQSQRETIAEGEFNKELAKVAAKTPDKVTEFLASKMDWITKRIEQKYGTKSGE